MSDNTAAGCLGVIILAGTIGSWIFAGVLAWDWIEPKSFFGALKFLIVWSILGYIFQLISGLVLAGLSKFFE